MISQDSASWRCPLDQIEQLFKADELTRVRFVERAVEAYQASAQNIVENVQNNQPTEAQTVSDGQQSADATTEIHQAVDNQAVESNQASNINHQSDHAQRSNHIRLLQESMERFPQFIRQVPFNETPAQQSASTEPIERRVHTRPVGLRPPRGRT